MHLKENESQVWWYKPAAPASLEAEAEQNKSLIYAWAQSEFKDTLGNLVRRY